MRGTLNVHPCDANETHPSETRYLGSYPIIVRSQREEAQINPDEKMFESRHLDSYKERGFAGCSAPHPTGTRHTAHAVVGGVVGRRAGDGRATASPCSPAEPGKTESNYRKFGVLGGERGAWSRFWGKSSKNWGLGLWNWAGVKRNSVGVNGNSPGVKEIWGGVKRNWVGVNRNSTPENGNWRGVAANSLAGNRNSVPDHRNWVTGKENSASHNRNSTAKAGDGVSVRENSAGFDFLFRAARSLPNPTCQVIEFNCCCRGCLTWAGGRRAWR